MTIQEKIDALKKEFADKIAELEKQAKAEQKQGKVWKPKKSEAYCCLFGHDVGNDVWTDKDVDQARFIRGNVLTKKEAEWRDQHRIVATELKRFVTENDPRPITEEDWENISTNKYRLTFNYPSKSVRWVFVNEHKDANEVYASNAEVIIKAIEHIGEERLKKYYFGVGK